MSLFKGADRHTSRCGCGLRIVEKDRPNLLKRIVYIPSTFFQGRDRNLSYMAEAKLDKGFSFSSHFSSFFTV